MNNEILNGLSIEELEERAEFTAVPQDADLSMYSESELASMEADYAAGNYWKTGCRCRC
jgi:hypothetical protein